LVRPNHTERAIRRGSFQSVHELVARIDRFVEQHNAQCAPFVWYASADSILNKIERLCERISVEHSSLALDGGAKQVHH
jgi:phage-related protein